MEKNEEFQRVVANIKQLEEKLLGLDENTLINQHYNSEAESEIEDYFSNCVNALAMRKDSLLRELGLATKKLTEEGRKEVSTAIDVRKKLLETGSFVYNADIKTAEHVWKGVTNLPEPHISSQKIKLELPKSLLEVIKTHGKILLAKTEEAKNEEVEVKLEVKEVVVPAENHDIPKTDNLYSIVDTISTFVGTVAGLIDGKGEKVKFNTPRGICWNPNDDCLYICDKRNNSIRKITLQGEVSTFVRGNDGQLSWPQEICIHHKTNTFYVTNEYAHNIVKITADGMENCPVQTFIKDTGSVSVLAGSGKIECKDGIGANAAFCYPTGIAIDQKGGYIFVSDYNNHAIRIITQEGKASILAGSVTSGYVDGTGESARFNGPWGLLFDDISNSLLVCDYDNNKIRRVQLSGEVTTVCTVPRPSLASAAHNSILVASDEKNRVFTIPREGNPLVRILQQQDVSGNKDCKFCNAIGLAVHAPSHTCYIVSGHVVSKVTFK